MFFLKKKYNLFKSIEIQKNFLGLLISLVLTFIPFYLVKKNFFSNFIIISIIILCGVLQIFFHLFIFLHLQFNKKNKWNIISFIFSLIIILTLIFFSFWIMKNLHFNTSILD